MKYYKTSRFARTVGGLGFYAVIVCCLLAIGAAGWFAVSKYNGFSERESEKDNTPPTYSAPEDSYNSSETAPVESKPSKETAENVSSVPYEENAEAQVQQEVPEEPKAPERSFVMPIAGNVTKGYSDIALQYSETFGDMRIHAAVDIAADKGAEVVAAGAGTVTAIADDVGLGKTVTIDHGDGITAKYCGFESCFVNEGDAVSAGNPIGEVGTIPAECADAPHIHIEVLKDGETVSPLTAFGLE